MIYLLSLLLSTALAAPAHYKGRVYVEFIQSKRNAAITYVFINLTDCMFEVPTSRTDDVDYMDKMIEGKCDPEVIYRAN